MYYAYNLYCNKFNAFHSKLIKEPQYTYNNAMENFALNIFNNYFRVWLKSDTLKLTACCMLKSKSNLNHYNVAHEVQMRHTNARVIVNVIFALIVLI